jgi:hypothetical protein
LQLEDGNINGYELRNLIDLPPVTSVDSRPEHSFHAVLNMPYAAGHSFYLPELIEDNWREVTTSGKGNVHTFHEGIYTVPVNGRYFVSYNVDVTMTYTNAGTIIYDCGFCITTIRRKKVWYRSGCSYVKGAYKAYRSQPVTGSSILDLKEGDKVGLTYSTPQGHHACSRRNNNNDGKSFNSYFQGTIMKEYPPSRE